MKPIHILLVEDNEGDIFLTTEALEESNIVNQISVAKDGQEALDFIFKTKGFEDKTTPDLVLLDVNLPRKSGHEVLRELKTHQTFRKIPVIMLTTSSSRRDIDLSYEYHANCFITKPVEVTDFLDAIASIEQFWLRIASLPN
ncbi:Response regulator receiver domain-containing protein [Cyclobacterium lianum]|uniref:Response regulator receiver domain-containing protein n=1 Tax=Cyclobacterium lianum TaxID=388280 RepID=A0A1M7NV76_9BACT|nr:response regulator [Cyclobacterium lianum]SHN08015.1 Response regulator receiver domain-containing protein [Cyclobacterium lianum]